MDYLLLFSFSRNENKNKNKKIKTRSKLASHIQGNKIFHNYLYPKNNILNLAHSLVKICMKQTQGFNEEGTHYLNN